MNRFTNILDNTWRTLLVFCAVMALSACEQKKAAEAEPGSSSATVSSEQVAVVESMADSMAEQESEIDPFDDVDVSGFIQEKLIVPPPPPDRPPTFYEQLSRAALERTSLDIFYDGRYQKMAYPMGDVPAYLGVCTDLVVRSYRSLGIDLQQLVHEDMRKAFHRYPSRNKWGLTSPDPNIDHRRVPNLQVFFERHGESLPISDHAEAYQPGDIVTWNLNEKMTHIGIVSEQPSYEEKGRYLIIHNIGKGPELSDMLFDFEITGHYRFQPEQSGPDKRVVSKH